LHHRSNASGNGDIRVGLFITWLGLGGCRFEALYQVFEALGIVKNKLLHGFYFESLILIEETELVILMKFDIIVETSSSYTLVNGVA